MDGLLRRPAKLPQILAAALRSGGSSQPTNATPCRAATPSRRHVPLAPEPGTAQVLPNGRDNRNRQGARRQITRPRRAPVTQRPPLPEKRHGQLARRIQSPDDEVIVEIDIGESPMDPLAEANPAPKRKAMSQRKQPAAAKNGKAKSHDKVGGRAQEKPNPPLDAEASPVVSSSPQANALLTHALAARSVFPTDGETAKESPRVLNKSGPRVPVASLTFPVVAQKPPSKQLVAAASKSKVRKASSKTDLLEPVEKRAEDNAEILSTKPPQESDAQDGNDHTSEVIAKPAVRSKAGGQRPPSKRPAPLVIGNRDPRKNYKLHLLMVENALPPEGGPPPCLMMPPVNSAPAPATTTSANEPEKRRRRYSFIGREFSGALPLNGWQKPAAPLEEDEEEEEWDGTKVEQDFEDFRFIQTAKAKLIASSKAKARAAKSKKGKDNSGDENRNPVPGSPPPNELAFGELLNMAQAADQEKGRVSRRSLVAEYINAENSQDTQLLEEELILTEDGGSCWVNSTDAMLLG